MRCLLDAQLSRRLVINLEQAGYQASHLFDHIEPSADDPAEAALANRLGASVVSKGADFAELTRRGVLVRTVVWLRIPNLSNHLLWPRVARAHPSIVSASRANLRIFEVH
jgi:predicted nuclease of predicted toxin-antitoxin system